MVVKEFMGGSGKIFNMPMAISVSQVDLWV